jgi:hypothetical protein
LHPFDERRDVTPHSCFVITALHQRGDSHSLSTVRVANHRLYPAKMVLVGPHTSCMS